MRPTRRFLLVSFLLIVGIWAGAAWAQSVGNASGPGWQSIALGLVSIITLIGSGFVTSQSRRIRDLEQAVIALEKANSTEFTVLKTTLARDLHDADAIEKMMERLLKPVQEKLVDVQRSNHAVHRRLDFLRVPQSDAGQGERG